MANFSADSLSVLMNSASWEAAIWFLLSFSTASVEPPQLLETALLASHCGRSAARHLPDVLAAAPGRNTGPQAAIGKLAHLPLFRPWYHESLKSASFEAVPLVTRSPQNLATFLASSLARSTLTVCLPSKANGRTPACQR